MPINPIKSFKNNGKTQILGICFIYLMHKFNPEYANNCKELDIDRYQIQHDCLLPNATHESIGDSKWSSSQSKESAEYILHSFPFIMSLNVHISCIASTSRVDPLFCSGIRKSWNQYHVFNTPTLSFRSQKYYWLPVLTGLKQLWSPPREFGPQIQF